MRKRKGIELMLRLNARKFTLIYFTGCPNAEDARKTLLDLSASYDEVNQDELSPGDARLKYTSPTILLNGEILFGSHTDGESRGCSIERLDVEALANAIKAIK